MLSLFSKPNASSPSSCYLCPRGGGLLGEPEGKLLSCFLSGREEVASRGKGLVGLGQVSFDYSIIVQSTVSPCLSHRHRRRGDRGWGCGEALRERHAACAALGLAWRPVKTWKPGLRGERKQSRPG